MISIDSFQSFPILATVAVLQGHATNNKLCNKDTFQNICESNLSFCIYCKKCYCSSLLQKLVSTYAIDHSIGYEIVLLMYKTNNIYMVLNKPKYSTNFF